MQFTGSEFHSTTANSVLFGLRVMQIFAGLGMLVIFRRAVKRYIKAASKSFRTIPADRLGTGISVVALGMLVAGCGRATTMLIGEDIWTMGSLIFGTNFIVLGYTLHFTAYVHAVYPMQRWLPWTWLIVLAGIASIAFTFAEWFR